MIWNPLVVLSSERPDMHAPGTKMNMWPDEFNTTGVILSPFVYSQSLVKCL